MGDASTTATGSAFGSSGEAAAAAAAEEDRHEEVLLRHEENGDGDGNGAGSAFLVNNSAEEDDKEDRNVEDGGDRSDNFGRNRWPRQETLALLKIRSDMDATFRDSSLKAPLWEEVSRKLAELGYKRSGKKCKEKFENVYKYHRRTKDGRTGKSDGKTYRFFDQLEAFDQNHHPPPPPLQAAAKVPHQAITNPPISTNVSHNIFVNPNPTSNNISITLPPPPPPPTSTTSNSLPSPQTIITKSMITNHNNNINGLLFSSPTSSSTASDEEFQARHKRKRKWRDFFRRLTREVVRKQEEMHKRFLETVAKCEHERTAREEAWRLQEMARINREHEILLQERSAATAKDAALIAFLQKVSGVTQNLQIISTDNVALSVLNNSINNNHHNNNTNNHTISLPAPQPAAKQAATAAPPHVRSLSTTSSSSWSSRWPKAEVEALINLRTNLDLKYEENVPKGPLWEDISAGMRRLGYDRSSKRCKEKWENINKYFKKVKDSDKKRSDDSKTCPYFHQLDAIYREKLKNIDPKAQENGAPHPQQPPPHFGMEPLMVQPERQWPLQEEEYDQEEEVDRDTSSSTEVEDQDHDDHDNHREGTGDGSYGIVSNVQSSMDMVE
ncbi:Trihelix transcription factor GT-2 [Morus notabilis]|uniref:Trihelix transcription factor GT-2 n=1 Tax=Morus notabilis TaxID=981085 RepID=W9S035_9ROSA|nr:trihelix transcription factor GT-2 [Morus notabilis]EXC19897.1 Trihelix transcription factor GT-2 [Morus notabilis]